MRKPELKQITAALRQLTPDQHKSVAAELAALDAQPASTELIEGRFACGATCPYCKAMHVIRNGHANKLQRYGCRKCCKTFSTLAGNSLNRLHKRGKWLEQAHAVQGSHTRWRNCWCNTCTAAANSRRPKLAMKD